MAENDRPNDGGNYSSLQWREVWLRFLGNGVIPGVENVLECTGDGATMNIAVDSGEAMVNGCWYQNTASQNQAQTSDATHPRINRIVLRWTSAADSVICATLAGTPAASPVAPTLTRDANTWEYSLCQVYIAALAATLATSNITREADWARPKGGIALDLTNQSGGTLVLGDVVVQDSANNEAVDTTTTARDQGVIGVIGEYSIADTVAGDVVTAGYAWVLMDAATTRGQWLVTSTTAKKATPKTNLETGAFGRALETISGAGLCLCFLFGAPVGGTDTPTAYMPMAYDSGGKAPASSVDSSAIVDGTIVPADMTAYSRHGYVWFISGDASVAANQTKLKYPVFGTATFERWDMVAGTTAPTGASLILDINKDGTTIFTTQGNRPTLAAAASESNGNTFDVTTATTGDLLSMDVDQIGSGEPGEDVTLVLWFKRPLVG